MSAHLLTIGHGVRDWPEFASLLARYGVDTIVDVRTVPYSAHQPVYDRETLKTALQRMDIRYVFLGEELGGRPNDPTCYTGGKADYAKMAKRPIFHAGLDRLARGLAHGLRIALLCSEGRPEECHRTRLIAQCLEKRLVQVSHIDEHGQLRSQADIMARLTGGQAELFGDGFVPMASGKRIRKP